MQGSLPLLSLLAIAGLASAQAFDSGNMGPGESWSHTFEEVNEAGYEYHCHPHPWMTGMVHVLPDDDGKQETVYVDIQEGPDAADWGYSIEHLVIQAGDTVVWNNTGAVIHTVTEATGDGSGHHGDHDHNGAGSDSNESPGFAWVGVVGAVAVALSMRRR